MITTNLQHVTPIDQLFNLDKADLADISDRLWFEYYSSKEALTKPQKKFIMEQFNIISDKMNKDAGRQIMIKITQSMLWDNAKSENPNIKKPIYAECIEYEYTGRKKVSAITKSIIADVVKRVDAKEKKEKNKLDKAIGLNNNKWYDVYIRHTKGDSNEKIMEDTGYSTKQVRDAIYRYATNRVKGKK